MTIKWKLLDCQDPYLPVNTYWLVQVGEITKYTYCMSECTRELVTKQTLADR